MRRMVEKILRYYGREIRIQGRDEPVIAFFQPVTGKGSNMAQINTGPLGMEQVKQYVYIGPVEPVLHAEDVLETDGAQYLVRRAEEIDGMNGPVYQWAMCVAKGEIDVWGMDHSG